VPISIADMNAGLHGLSAVLAALYMRERCGHGQHIDIAMLDTAAHSGLRGPAPYRGEHNEVVLREWLGSDDAELEQLRAARVLLEEAAAAKP